MAKSKHFHNRRRERGISLMVVVIVIFALLGMAALAIDLVTLYVGRTQAQRIADAAALAGAKTLVEYGVTADPTDSHSTWNAMCAQAAAQAQRIGNRGRIGGLAPLSVVPQFCSGGSCSAACPEPSGTIGTGFGVNPQVSVEVTSTPLPLFFAKIWGQTTATVAATGQAEGFNPSGTDVPLAAKGVVPWLLPNMDPGAANGPIFDATSGQITNNMPRIGGAGTGIVGETISLTNLCSVTNCGTPSAPIGGGYYPLDIPNTPTSQPNCSLATTYHQNVASYNPTSITCGSTIDLNKTGNPKNVTMNQDAINCRIGATAPGPGFGQDVLDVTTFPYEINAGNTHNGVAPGNQISTSRSVVTLPVYDSAAVGVPASPVTVIGFVQGFVSLSDVTTGEPRITVLNVSGCSAVARASAVPAVGLNEGSAVPVRLIHN